MEDFHEPRSVAWKVARTTIAAEIARRIAHYGLPELRVIHELRADPAWHDILLAARKARIAGSDKVPSWSSLQEWFRRERLPIVADTHILDGLRPDQVVLYHELMHIPRISPDEARSRTLRYQP